MGAIVELDPVIHREQFFELNVEYIGWIVQEMRQRHDIDLEEMLGESVREYVDGVIDEFLTVRPPIGITFVIEQDNELVGMGALREHAKGIGEIKRMYVQPRTRGQGLGWKLFTRLIDTGKEF